MQRKEMIISRAPLSSFGSDVLEIHNDGLEINNNAMFLGTGTIG